MQTKYLCVLITCGLRVRLAPRNGFKPSSKIYLLTVPRPSFVDHLCFSVLCLLCLCVRLYICALWSPTGKGLTSWLSFVVSNCGILGHVWCMIVSIPDLCGLTYFIFQHFICNEQLKFHAYLI